MIQFKLNLTIVKLPSLRINSLKNPLLQSFYLFILSRLNCLEIK